MTTLTHAAPEHVTKLWGYETIFTNNYLYCGKILTCLPNGNACSIHYHKRKTETFHVLRGKLQLEVYYQYGDLVSYEVKLNMKLELLPGQSVTIPPFVPHRFWTRDEVAEFIEVSTTDYLDDSYRLVQAGPIPCAS